MISHGWRLISGGKIGTDSLAGVLSKEASGNSDIKKDEPYAEVSQFLRYSITKP